MALPDVRLAALVLAVALAAHVQAACGQGAGEPAITDIRPATPVPGAFLLVSGRGFGDEAMVHISGRQAERLTRVNDELLTLIVPENTVPGMHTLEVSPAGGGRATASLLVAPVPGAQPSGAGAVAASPLTPPSRLGVPQASPEASPSPERAAPGTAASVVPTPSAAPPRAIAPGQQGRQPDGNNDRDDGDRDGGDDKRGRSGDKQKNKSRR